MRLRFNRHLRLGNNRIHGIAIAEPLFNYRLSDTGILKSVSRKRHGGLWRDIQRRNRTAYSWRSLMRAYRSWRGTPSTYPLLLYFSWFILLKMMPMIAFYGGWCRGIDRAGRYVGRRIPASSIPDCRRERIS